MEANPMCQRPSQSTDYLSTVRDVMPLYLREILDSSSRVHVRRIYDAMLYHLAISPRLCGFGSFKILVHSCHNLLKTLTSFAECYNYTLNNSKFFTTLADLIVEVTMENSQYSIKKRIDHYANFLFPDSQLKLSGIRICSGPLGKFFRNWARRIYWLASKNERASCALSLLKVNRALCKGDFISLVSHDLKYRSSKEPMRSQLAQDELFSMIREVVDVVYKPKKFCELNHTDPPFHNGSFEYSKAMGGSHETVIELMDRPDTFTNQHRSIAENRGVERENGRDEYLYMGFHPKLGVSECKVHPWWDDHCEPLEAYDAKVCHIADKGKIRSITAISGIANHYIKKYQRYFFKPVWKFKQFTYTKVDARAHPEQFRDLLDCDLTKYHYWVSGDYEQCTDMFSRDWTNFVIQCVCKRVFGDDWMRHYDNLKGTTNLELPFFYGQPQGHGLSFAILCVINLSLIAMCFRTQSKINIRDLPVKINGDDIVFPANDDLYRVWCFTCERLGLKVNQTKSYRSATHFTLNSHAFCFEGDHCVNIPSPLFAQVVRPFGGSINLNLMCYEESCYYFKPQEDETVSEYSTRLQNFTRSSNEEDYIKRLKVFFAHNPIRPKMKKKRFQTKPPINLFVAQDRGGLGVPIPPFVTMNVKIKEHKIPTLMGRCEKAFNVLRQTYLSPSKSFLKMNGEQRAHMIGYLDLDRARHTDEIDLRDQFTYSETPHYGLGYSEPNYVNLDRSVLSCATEQEQPEKKEKSLKRLLDLTYAYRGVHHRVPERQFQRHDIKQRKIHKENELYLLLDWLESKDETIALTTFPQVGAQCTVRGPE